MPSAKKMYSIKLNKFEGDHASVLENNQMKNSDFFVLTSCLSSNEVPKPQKILLETAVSLLVF